MRVYGVCVFTVWVCMWYVGRVCVCVHEKESKETHTRSLCVCPHKLSGPLHGQRAYVSPSCLWAASSREHTCPQSLRALSQVVP